MPTVEFGGTLGVVLGDVVERVAAGAPFEIGDLADLLRHQRVRGEVHDENLVLAIAGPIDRVGESPAVVAHAVVADGNVGVGADHRVEIEQDFLGGSGGRGRAAAIDRILFVFLSARVVDETEIRHGRAGVVLLDAGDHFCVERRAEFLGRSEDRLSVGVLLLEIVHDGRVGFLAQPEVVVDALVLVDRDVLGLFQGDGRLGRGEVESGEGGGGGHEKAEQGAGEFHAEKCSPAKLTRRARGSMFLRPPPSSQGFLGAGLAGNSIRPASSISRRRRTSFSCSTDFW